MIKVRFIGRGMKMEFVHPTLGVIQTSKVRDVRTITPGFNCENWGLA